MKRHPVGMLAPDLNAVGDWVELNFMGFYLIMHMRYEGVRCGAAFTLLLDYLLAAK